MQRSIEDQSLFWSCSHLSGTSPSERKAGGKSWPWSHSWKWLPLVMRPEGGINLALPLITIAWEVGGSLDIEPSGWHPTSQKSILTMKWGWSTYLLGEGCSAAKIQETGAWEKANFEWPCPRYMGPNAACQCAWLKKLPFLDIVKFGTELGRECLSLGRTWTATVLGPGAFVFPHLPPAFHPLTFSNSSAEIFRTHFGHC